MSDFEDHNAFNLDSEQDANMQDIEEADKMDEDVVNESAKGKARSNEDEEDEEQGDEEEEDEEDEDDEDEEDEDEALGKKGRKRAKHRHKRSAASRFLDIEAEVSEDDEDEEDEEDLGGDGFIETADDADDDTTRRHHALLDSRRHLEAGEDKSPEQIAKDLSRRYGQRAVRYTGDMNQMPQRLLMPSVHDASLWQVRVKPGRERDIVFSLMRKSIDVEYTARPLNVLSAFQRDSLPGMIYVEARSAKQVQEACNGLVGVYPSRGIQLVPIEEMASLLQIKKQDLTVAPGSWVRIRRGKYAGDLAQVMDITENGEDVGLKFVPRIDLNPRDDASLDGAKKRKKATTGAGTMRPPQRLFNYEEVNNIYGRKSVTRRNQVFLFQNDTYRDGFIEKDFKLSALILEDVNPTLDEITQFSRRQDGGEVESAVDLSVIAEASRKAAISVLQPGDHVEVFEGEQAGVHGVVDEISQDVVTITAVGLDLDGQKIELPARSVRKRFKPGDHVKVMTGQNADETGLVVAVADNVVTFLSDMSMQEVSVFSKDLREAAEVGSGTNIVGNYELHDLVQLDAQTVGVIFKTERDSFRVLDQNGQIRLVQPHQISMRRNSTRAIAADSEGHEIRINDNMKEIDGEGRKGRVLHIHQSFFTFLHNRDIVENGGVFVTRTRSLVSLAPKSNVMKMTGVDVSKMNPALLPPTGGMVGSGTMGRGPRDRHIGLTVVVVKGPHKGYAGTIKDTNGPIARVELRTGNKIITIDKEKIYHRLPDGKIQPLDKVRTGPPNQGGMRTDNPYTARGGYGGSTQYSNSNSGRTPMHLEGRTPAWNSSSRTPNHLPEGGKTPAWNASSRTPNPYAMDGGRTPAWNANSRTPNPYVSGGGSGSWGGATPARTGASAGWASPGRTSFGNEPGWSSPPRASTWGDSAATWSAPTPAAAATPGLNIAPTPAFSAPTPAASARTPASWASLGSMSAPTPAPSSYTSYGDRMGYSAVVLPPEWLFDSAFANYLTRMKVRVSGTKEDNVMGGVHDDKEGIILSATRFGASYEETVVLELNNEKVSLNHHYVVPVPPSYLGEEALVLDGAYKGTVVTVREKPEYEKVTVSAKLTPTSMFEVATDCLVSLQPPNTTTENGTKNYPEVLSPVWLFDPAISNHLTRIKIKVSGTREDDVMGGVHDDEEGYVKSATKFGGSYDQTVVVVLGGENVTLAYRYVLPVPPSHIGEETLILEGPFKGKVVTVREKLDDEKFTVSAKATPETFEVSTDFLVSLHDTPLRVT